MLSREKLMSRVRTLLPSRMFAIGLIALALLAAFVPYAEIRFLAGPSWGGVLPELVGDSQFYISRAMTVADGHILGSNPYFIEHVGEHFPSTSFPDIVAALPFIAGLPPSLAVLWNVFFWCLAYVLLLFMLFRSFEFSPRLALLGAGFLLLGAYTYMLRQTSMQIFLPMYVAFLFLLSVWFTKKDILIATLLGCLLGVTIFAYPYLFVLVGSMWGVLLCYLLIYRRDYLAQYVFASVCAALIVAAYALPALLSVKDVNYHDTFMRYSVLFSHLPQIEEYYYGRWLLVGIPIFVLLRKTNSAPCARRNTLDVLFLCAGGALVALLSSNIIGIDIENAAHIGRFIVFWIFLTVFVVIFSRDLMFPRVFRKKFVLRDMVVFLLLLVLVMEAVISLPRSLVPLFMSKGDVREVESYAGVLGWLNTQNEQSVVLAPEQLSGYIPIETDHYILFNRYGVTFFASDRELEERYLLSRFPLPVTAASIEYAANDFWGGWKQYRSKNAKLWFGPCLRFLPDTWCTVPPPVYDEKDLARFREMEKEYQEYVLKDPVGALRKYHVRFVVLPANVVSQLPAAHSFGTVYEDEYYFVLEVPSHD